MSTNDPLDRKLASLGELPAPPPSPALIGMVRAEGAAKTRVPTRDLAIVVGVALASAVVHVVVAGVRSDLATLPPSWFWATAVAWLSAFLAPIAIALVPRRGSVLADSSRAAVVAVGVPLALVVLATFLRVDGPDTFLPPPEKELRYIGRCMLAGLEVAAVPFALALFIARRAALPAATRWLGSAIGAANGALAGFMLHAHCPIGGALHVAIGHAGGAVLGAVLGAIVVPLALARRR